MGYAKHRALAYEGSHDIVFFQHLLVLGDEHHLPQKKKNPPSQQRALAYEGVDPLPDPGPDVLQRVQDLVQLILL